jgi:hypothetical protein
MLSGQSLLEIAVNHVDALYTPKQVPQINVTSGQNILIRTGGRKSQLKNGNHTFYYVVTQNS